MTTEQLEQEIVKLKQDIKQLRKEMTNLRNTNKNNKRVATYAPTYRG